MKKFPFPVITPKKLRLLAFDIIGFFIAFALTYILDQNFYLAHPLADHDYLHDRFVLGAVFVGLHLCFDVFFLALFRLYSSIWKYAGPDELIRGISAIFISRFVALFVYILSCSLYYESHHYVNIHESSMLLFTFLFCFAVIGIRFGYRFLRSIVIRRNIRAPRIMIVGAGSGGAMVMEYLYKHEEEGHPICFVDDNPQKMGFGINGVYVKGTTNDMEQLAREHHIEQIWIAINHLDYSRMREIVGKATATGCKILTLPDMSETDKNSPAFRMKKVDVESILFREVKEFLDPDECRYLNDAVVLVTGGGGSIGSEICRQVSSNNPKKLVIFDIYENNAFELLNELKRKFPELDACIRIGSVRDTARLNEVFDEFMPQVVFHAAAHKHVPLMEDSPAEAVKNNVFGTYNTILCAENHGVSKFVLLSTDKAVNPTNVMGATKRLAELLVQTINRTSKCDFIAVRFGNVLGSNGSVIPIFKKQIAAGGPVTITHPDITRYFMTIREAAQLVLEAGAIAQGGEIFVLDMGTPVKIVDLAKNLIIQSGLRPDIDIPIEFVGLRPGEKLYEELSTDEEKKSLHTTAKDKIFVTEPVQHDADAFFALIERMRPLNSRDSQEILDIIQTIIPTFHHQPNH